MSRPGLNLTAGRRRVFRNRSRRVSRGWHPRAMRCDSSSPCIEAWRAGSPHCFGTGPPGCSRSESIVIDFRIADAVRREGPARAAKHIAGARYAAVGEDDGVGYRSIAGRAIRIDLVVDHALGLRDDVRARVIHQETKPTKLPPARDT